MTITRTAFISIAAREILLFAYLLLGGLLLLPIAIFLVGQWVFGDYAGAGLSDFFERIFRGFVGGHDLILFLVLSPYLGWQVLRLTIWLFHRDATPTASRTPSGPTR